MITDRFFSWLAPLAASALLLGGCVPSSIASDLTRVRELSQAPVLATVADTDIAPESSQEVRAILARPLDADAAVRIALLQNRMLRAQLRELGVFRGRLMQAGLVANPVLEAEFLPERDTSVELRVEYDVTSLVLAPLRAKAAASDLEAARLDAAGAVIQLGYDVRAAFYGLQAAEQRLAVAEKALDAFAASRDAAQALADAGNIQALEASTQIAAYERARITVAQIELEAAGAREKLQRLLGLYGTDSAWTLRAGLRAVPEEMKPLERPESRAVQASLELAATRSRLEALARRTGLARTEGLLPEIAVDVHTLFGRPESVPGEPTPAPWRVGGGVSFTVPLFDRKQGHMRAYEAEFDGLMERYHGLAIDLRSAVREAQSRLISAHARARQLQTVVLPAHGRILEQMILQYNAMQVSVFDLLRARREQLDVELAYIDTLREYWSAAASLDALQAGRRVQGPAPAEAPAMNAGSESAGGH